MAGLRPVANAGVEKRPAQKAIAMERPTGFFLKLPPRFEMPAGLLQRTGRCDGSGRREWAGVGNTRGPKNVFVCALMLLPSSVSTYSLRTTITYLFCC